MSPRNPDHGTPRQKTTLAGQSAEARPLKDPVPAVACVHPDGTGVAIHGGGSPDLAERVAAFDAEHQGDGHQRVARLPKQRGDPK